MVVKTADILNACATSLQSSSTEAWTLNDLQRVWKAVSEFIFDTLKHGRAVRLPPFGTFTYAIEASEMGPHGRTMRRSPVFLLSPNFASSCSIRMRNKPVGEGINRVPATLVNTTAIAASLGRPREAVVKLISEVFVVLRDNLLKNQPVELDFPRVMTFWHSDKNTGATVRFAQPLVHELATSVVKTTERGIAPTKIWSKHSPHKTTRTSSSSSSRSVSSTRSQSPSNEHAEEQGSGDTSAPASTRSQSSSRPGSSQGRRPTELREAWAQAAKNANDSTAGTSQLSASGGQSQREQQSDANGTSQKETANTTASRRRRTRRMQALTNAEDMDDEQKAAQWQEEENRKREERMNAARAVAHYNRTTAEMTRREQRTGTDVDTCYVLNGRPETPADKVKQETYRQQLEREIAHRKQLNRQSREVETMLGQQLFSEVMEEEKARRTREREESRKKALEAAKSLRAQIQYKEVLAGAGTEDSFADPAQSAVVAPWAHETVRTGGRRMLSRAALANLVGSAAMPVSSSH